jgi:DNA-binding CsgD family transcriptional regulator
LQPEVWGVRPTPLFGRSTEIEELVQALDAARSGRGQVATLQGEAGIGKTRLVAALRDAAVAMGVVVRLGDAQQIEQTRPFGAIADALGIALGASDPRRSALAREILRQDIQSVHLEDVPVAVHRLVEQVVELFEVSCGEGPLLLIIENLHWADPSTIACLHRLARLTGQYPALLLVTTRPSDRPEVANFMVLAGSAHGTHLEIGGLDPQAVASLAGQVAGASPGPRLAVQLEKARGNPLFVIELTSSLVGQGLVHLTADGSAETEETDASVTLSLTILHRLSLLPSPTIEVLRMASILGPRFDLDELALLARRPAIELAERLRAAATAGVIDHQGRLVTFRHDLIQDALYKDWPEPVRRGLHLDLGRALAALGAPPHRVAPHLSLGADPGDAEAVSWLHRAGLEAAPVAPAAGAQLFERAAELARPGDPVRDSIRTDLAIALVWSGRTAEGDRLARDVIAQTPSPDTGARAAWWLASSLFIRGQALEARDLARAALQTDVKDERLRLLLRLTEALTSLSLGEAEASVRKARELLEDARRIGDPGALCRCLVGLVIAEGTQGRLATAARHGAEAIAVAETLPPAEMTLVAAHLCHANWVLIELDRLDEALQTVQRVRALAGELPDFSSAILHDIASGIIRYLGGRWDDAQSDLDTALATSAAGTDGFWADVLPIKAMIEVHRGQLPAARADLARSDQHLAAGGSCWYPDRLMLARALLLEAEGQPEESLGLLEGAWGLAEALPMPLALPRLGPFLTRGRRSAADAPGARRAAGQVWEVAQRNPEVPRLQATAAWCEGIAEGDPDLLLAAVEGLRQGSHPLEKALACEDAAACLAASRRLPEARLLLQEAIEGYEQLQAAHRVASALSRLRSLGLRLGARGARGRPATGWGALTETEVRVVRLIAQHMSNPEIAQQLVLSRRTVETHVSHALAKLGCTSRRELAAQAPRHPPD